MDNKPIEGEITNIKARNYILSAEAHLEIYQLEIKIKKLRVFNLNQEMPGKCDR